MRIVPLIRSTSLAFLLANLPYTVHAAAEGTIKISSIAQVEVEVAGKEGKKTHKLAPVEQAIPGTEVIFTNTFENISNKAASDIVINNPIPENTEYKAGSAFGKDCEILFSIDHGHNFGVAESLKIKGSDGAEHTALPKEYTDIRWTYKKPLAAGKSSEVGFRATIK
jgi:uncharacterized repeat protein (TIGR01451 family)